MNADDMNLPKISVITPTYNAAGTVGKALASVAGQNYLNIEHLIIDGLSTDGTTAIIREYQQKYDHIKLISEKDRGIYDAMNKGIRHSTGDWLYFLGADDELSGATIFTELFEEGYLFKRDVLYGNVQINGAVSWANNQTIYDGPFDLHKLLTKNICHQAILYPAFVVKEAGLFKEKYHITADWEYNIRCYARHKFVYVDKVIAIFNGGGESSTGDMDELFKDLPGLLIKYFHLNPRDKSIYSRESPFYYFMSLYQKKKTFFDKTSDFIYSILARFKNSP